MHLVGEKYINLWLLCKGSNYDIKIFLSLRVFFYTFWTPVAAVLIIDVLVVGCFKSWAVTMWFCKSITELQSWRQMWQVLFTMFKLLVKFWLSMAIIWDSMIKEFFVAATLILINVPFHKSNFQEIIFSFCNVNENYEKFFRGIIKVSSQI